MRQNYEIKQARNVTSQCTAIRSLHVGILAGIFLSDLKRNKMEKVRREVEAGLCHARESN